MTGVQTCALPIWLETAKGVSKDMPIRDISVSGLANRMVTSELSSVVDNLWKTLISQRVMLDLPWALWQR